MGAAAASRDRGGRGRRCARWVCYSGSPGSGVGESDSNEDESDGGGDGNRDGDDVAISAPAEPRYPNPVNPPMIDTLLEWIRGGWTNPDPDVLVFDTTATTEQGVVTAVDDELRYREVDSHRWVTVTDKEELYHHLQQQGQTVQSLSETPLTRQHFTPSPLTQ